MEQKDLFKFEPPPTYTPKADPLAGKNRSEKQIDFRSESKQQYQVSTSLPSQNASSSLKRFCSLSLHMTDKLRFVNFPQNSISRLEFLVANIWSKGIQSTRIYAGCSYEIQLRGTPWYLAFNTAPRTEPRRFMCHILRGLYDMGFRLATVVDASSKLHDKDTLMFEYYSDSTSEPLSQPITPMTDWMVIAFDSSDTITMIDAPVQLVHSLILRLEQATNAPPSLSTSHSSQASSSQTMAVANIPTSSNLKGVKHFVQSHKSHSTIPSTDLHVYTIKLYGNPFHANGEETVRTRLILLFLLEAMEEIGGWRVYGSMAIDNGPNSDQVTGMDCWICCR